MNQSVLKFQQMATKKGIYTGELDGIPGRLTLLALRLHFHPQENPPQWMTWASNELGVSEILGERDNPRIVYYHQFASLKAQDDETAWCASFICAALEESGVRSTRSAAAASFKNWGQASTPDKFGSIALIKRTGGSGRHVFFSAGVYNGHVFALGGNQKNKVSVETYPVSAVTECRFPK